MRHMGNFFRRKLKVKPAKNESDDECVELRVRDIIDVASSGNIVYSPSKTEKDVTELVAMLTKIKQRHPNGRLLSLSELTRDMFEEEKMLMQDKKSISRDVPEMDDIEIGRVLRGIEINLTEERTRLETMFYILLQIKKRYNKKILQFSDSEPPPNMPGHCGGEINGIQTDPATGQVYADFSFSGTGRIQMGHVQGAHDGPLTIHDKYVEESDEKKEKTIVLEVNQRNHMADLVGKVANKQQSLVGAIVTDFITENELIGEVRTFEQEIQKLLSEQFDEVMSIKMSHRELPSKNNLSSKKRYTIMYEATVNGVVVPPNELEEKMQAMITKQFPRCSVVPGSFSMCEDEEESDTLGEAGQVKRKNILPINFDQVESLLETSHNAIKSSSLTFGGCFVSSIIPNTEVNNLMRSFDQIINFVVQQSLGNIKFNVEASLVSKPVFESALGVKRAITYAVEVNDATFTNAMASKINSHLDQYISRSIPQLSRFPSANFSGTEPVDLALFEDYVGGLANKELKCRKMRLNKKVLLTTGKMSYDSLVASLPQMKSQLAHLLSTYGDVDFTLTIVNEPTDVDQEFTLELDINLSGTWPSETVRTIETDITNKLAHFTKASPIIAASHPLALSNETPSTMGTVCAASISAKREIDQIKKKLIQQQKSATKLLTEMVLTTPVLEKAALPDYVNNIEKVLTRKFAELGIKSETTIQVLNANQDSGRFVLQTQSFLFGELSEAQLAQIQLTLADEVPGVEIIECQLSKEAQGPMSKLKSSVTKATQKALERFVNEKKEKEKETEEIKLKVEKQVIVERKRKEEEEIRKQEEEIRKQEEVRLEAQKREEERILKEKEEHEKEEREKEEEKRAEERRLEQEKKRILEEEKKRVIEEEEKIAKEKREEEEERVAKGHESSESDSTADSTEHSEFTISNELELNVNSIEDIEQNKDQIEGELMKVLSHGSLGEDVEVVNVDVEVKQLTYEIYRSTGKITITYSADVRSHQSKPMTRRKIKEGVNATFKNFAKVLKYFDGEQLNKHNVSFKHITSKMALITRSKKASLKRRKLNGEQGGLMVKIDIGNIAGTYIKADDKKSNVLSLLSGKMANGETNSKIGSILNRHHNNLVERLAMIKSSFNLTAAIKNLWSYDISDEILGMIFKVVTDEEFITFDQLCAVIKYKYHDILQNERANEFVDATKYYFDDFKCDQTLEHHLNQVEFISFWRKVLAIFFQLDKDGGGDIGVMEVVRFLEKNAKRYGIDKSVVYSKTSQAFAALDDDGSLTLDFIESYCFLPQLIQNSI